MDYKRLINQAIFYGVKSLNAEPKRENITREEAETDSQFAQEILDFMGSLTPAEFVNLFPIRKDFKSGKWEMKDYFYTRDYIQAMGPTEPIGENVLDFLWEYLNRDLQMFTVNVMGYTDNLRRIEGEPSMMEEWADMNGVRTYSKHTDSCGKEFFMDKEAGKTIRVVKPKPRRKLKLVKGIG